MNTDVQTAHSLAVQGRKQVVTGAENGVKGNILFLTCLSVNGEGYNGIEGSGSQGEQDATGRGGEDSERRHLFLVGTQGDCLL
jgi:hypothetical protein